MANNKVYSDYLMHGRTKGSRNGISTTKGYTAVGHKAKGRYINGRYVYENNTPKIETKGHWVDGRYVWETKPSGLDKPNNIGIGKQIVEQRNKAARAAKGGQYGNLGIGKQIVEQRNKDATVKKSASALSAKGAKNNWQQLGNVHRSALTMNNSNSRVQDYRGMPASVTSEIIPRDNARMEKRPEVKAFNAWHNAQQQHNAEVTGKEAALKYQQKQAAVKKAKEDGAKNNWQQQAAATSASARAKNDWRTGKNSAIYVVNSWHKGGAVIKPDFLHDPSYKNALAKASLRNAAAKGVNNNWQQRANKVAGKGLTYDKVTESGIHYDADLGTNQWRGSMSQKQKDARKALTSKTKAAKAESQLRNSRSDIGNAFADLKEDAKNTFKALKSKIKKKKK